MVCDLHTHSEFSFDGRATVRELCLSAVGHKTDVIAITDHCDMTKGAEGIAFYLDHEKERLEAIQRTQEELHQIELLNGIEIGNAIDMPEEANHFLVEREFDFVIGAIHFLPDGSDIYKLPYRSASEIDWMFRRYFESIEKLVDMGGFDSLAHLDYPLRVLRGKLPSATITSYRDQVEMILKKLVQREIALEINTRGTYDWQKRVGPEDWVLSKYRELGGSYITIGSDAHTTAWVGAGFPEAVSALRRTGFDAFTIYRNRRPCQVRIESVFA